MNNKKSLFKYVFWGMFTVGINFAVIYVLHEMFEMDELDSNIVAWMISNYVMYVGVKKTVFHSQTHGIKEYIVQLNYYYLSRIVTLAIEEMIIWKMVVSEGIDLIYVKIFTTILVGVLNLLLSKFFVFQSDNESENKHVVRKGYLA